MVVRKAQGRTAHTMLMNTHGCWVCIMLDISFLPIQIKILQQAKLLVARTLGVTFAFLLQILGWWQGPMNDILSVYECRLSKIGTLTGGWDTQTLTAKIKFV